MNVYLKLQKARVMLQEKDLKKTGENKFAGYEYFELGDFLPTINNIFLELGLFGRVSFTNEFATLTVINTDQPEQTIEFTSPMATASLKGCHEIQNVGAVETYQRRYLYTTALEIVEHDALDKTTGKEKEQHKSQHTQQNPSTQAQTGSQGDNRGQQQSGVKLATEAQVKMLNIKLKSAGMDISHVNKFLNLNIVSMNDLPIAKVNDLLKYLDENRLPA